MPPKKNGKKNKDPDAKSKEKTDERDTDKDAELVKELESVTNELEEVKKRVETLKNENEWLDQEAQRITEESQEYLNFMTKKANMRQNSIITLTDHNKEEIESIKKQKEELTKDFEAKKIALQNNLIEKQNQLNKVRAEIEEMFDYKELKQKQLEEIKELENEIVEVRRDQTKIISELRSNFLREKNEHKKEADNRIATIVKIANKEARQCLSENTYNIKVENQQLRKELFDLIELSKNLNGHKEKLEKQKIELLSEIKYAEDLKKVRSTHQQRVIEKLYSKQNE